MSFAATEESLAFRYGHQRRSAIMAVLQLALFEGPQSGGVINGRWPAIRQLSLMPAAGQPRGGMQVMRASRISGILALRTLLDTSRWRMRQFGREDAGGEIS